MNKTNNILTPFIIGLATLVASVNAQAQSANDQTTDPTNWAVGAGATFSGGPQGCSPAILLGFYSQVPDCATGISFALERKLSTNLSLVGQLSGHYASNQNSSQYSEGSSDASQYVNKSASIAMGPHWTFNPKSKVSFGTFLMLGAGYATSSRSPETKTSSSSLSGTHCDGLIVFY
jgi:hypothetical protein